jgi:hypothetical protein
MQVEMIDGLARPGIHIENRAVTLLMDIRLHGQFLGHLKHLADKSVLFWGYIVERRDMFSGYD